MIRFAGVHILAKNNVSSTRALEIGRKICANSCVQNNKSKAKEMAEKKRKDEEMRWTKLFHFNDLKYLAIITKLKIYPFFSTVLLTPVAHILQVSGIYPDLTAIPFAVIGEN